MNTPTLTWAYTRTFKDGGKEEIRNSDGIGTVSPVKRVAVYLNEKYKMGYK